VEEGPKVLPVKIRRIGTALEADPLEITVDPVQVKLVLEPRLSKVLPIIPAFKGSPEPGYERVDHQISPPAVEVSGPRSILKKMTSVSTDAINLTGVKEDSTYRVHLAPNYSQVSLSSSDSVEVRVTIRQAVALKTFESVPITVVNLDSRLALESRLPSGSLQIQGSQEKTQAFAPNEQTFTLDLSSVRQPGTYILPVITSIPPDLLVVSQDPPELTVKVVEKERK
jgi:YbbR domain-containing protein